MQPNERPTMKTRDAQQDSRLLQYMLDTYGPTMDMDQLAAVLHKSPKTMRMDYSRDRVPVPTYKLGRKRVAQTLEVFDYIQGRREVTEETA